MECARCGEATVDTPCRVCGEDPRLDGRYRLLEPIGRGASGNTWRARDERTGQVVAIKEMLLSRASSAKTRELWEREVRVLQQLDHPQIPRYVDSFEAGRGRTRSLCLVQELVEGRTLEEEMRRRRYSEDDALAVARGLAPVLDYLHGLQPPVVHRDLKPSNVIRARDGRLVLIDFGAVRDALADAQLGGSTVAGTFGYMAPEQFRGDAGPATDAYALGGLLVTLLTRMPPHRLLDPRGHLVWQPHCRVSPATAHLVDSLLQADPADRPTGAFEMERTLALGPPAELVHVASFPDRALRVAAGMVAVGGVLAAAGLAFLATGAAAVHAVRPTHATATVLPILQLPEGPVRAVRRDEVRAEPAWVWNAGPAALALHGAATARLEPARVEAVPTGAPLTLAGADDGWASWIPGPGQLVRCADDGCALEPWAPLGGPPERATPPAWPYAAEGRGQACDVTVHVGPDGSVVEARADGCPTAFGRVAEGAVSRWRWAAGEAREGVVTVAFAPRTPRDVLLAGTGELSVDGVAVGALPWMGPLSVGVHEVRVDGRSTWVEVEPGDRAQLVRM